jgi:T-complex protein 1 subunit delta
MESQVIVHDYNAMDRILKEERKYIIDLVKKISATGCNVLLVQKSVMRDATNDLSLHFLAKKGIMVIKNIERDHIEFISKTINACPVAHIDQFTKEKLGTAKLCQEVSVGEQKVIKITDVPGAEKTCSILVRGSNHLVIDEAERSIHDALCVIRALVKKRSLVPGGAAVEMEVATRLMEYSTTVFGVDSYIIRAYAEALEVVPYTLSENAGLEPIQMVTDLRTQHQKGNKYHGLNVKKNVITNMLEANVIQPTLVSLSAFTLATECVRMILKIDDIVLAR